MEQLSLALRKQEIIRCLNNKRITGRGFNEKSSQHENLLGQITYLG